MLRGLCNLQHWNYQDSLHQVSDGNSLLLCKKVYFFKLLKTMFEGLECNFLRKSYQLFGKIATGQTSVLQTTQPLEEQLSQLSAVVAQLVQGQQEGPVDDQLHQKMETLKEKCLRSGSSLDDVKKNCFHLFTFLL